MYKITKKRFLADNIFLMDIEALLKITAGSVPFAGIKAACNPLTAPELLPVLPAVHIPVQGIRDISVHCLGNLPRLWTGCSENWTGS